MNSIETSRRRHIIALFILFHVVAVIVAAIASADRPAVSSAIFISLVFCQTSLVGMWSALAPLDWIVRLIGLFVGTLLLWQVLQAGLGGHDPRGTILLLVSVASSGVAIVFWIVRLFRARICVRGVDDIPLRDGLQFNIKHLMLLTLLVACLMTAGRILAPYFRGLNQATEITALGLCFVSVALVGIWAMLGTAHPAPRACFALLVAVGAGYVAAYALGHVRNEEVFWISTAVLEAVFLMGSLLVLRRCGYRLVRTRFD